MWIPAKWALQFDIGLLWESTVSCEIAARPVHILQAIQQTSENYSIRLSVRGGEKLNKTIKIDEVLPTVEAGSNGLSETHDCVCQTWAMLTAQQAIAKIIPEEHFQKALRGKKNNQLSRKTELKKLW